MRRALAQSRRRGPAPPCRRPWTRTPRRDCDRWGIRRRPARRSTAVQRADDPKRLVALNEEFNTALEAFNSGRTDEALSRFLALLRERPDFLTARTSAATVLMATTRPKRRSRCSSRSGPQARRPRFWRSSGRRCNAPATSGGRPPPSSARARRQSEPRDLQRSRRRLRAAGEVTRRAPCFRSCCSATRTRLAPGPIWALRNCRRTDLKPRPTRFATP
jgi:hypothetical protein